MEERQTIPCPHCGADLPAEAAFCPRCARSVNRRTVLRPPAFGGRRALRRGLQLLVPLILVLTVMLGWRWASRPQVCEGVGEVVYTDADGSYQLTLAWANSPYEPLPVRYSDSAQGEDYRYPSLLFIHRADTGEEVTQHFLRKVKAMSASFRPLDEHLGTISCLPPALDDTFTQGNSLVSYVDYTAQADYTARMDWVFEMENGDVIRIAQDLVVTCIPVDDYWPGEVPMETAEQLQALVDRIAAGAAEGERIVNIHLPAVTYTEPVVVSGQAISFYGSEEAGRRTAFAAPLRLDYTADSAISYIENIDFLGDGTGVGLAASARARAVDCTFSNWKTGFLGYGAAWVNAIGCTFTGNQTGFHFNSSGESASHSMYNDNRFADNGAAVLLENVPTDLTLNFQGSVFTGNGVDIDNRCGHSLDITQAVFQ